MATLDFILFSHSQSITKPSSLNGSNYTYWKNRKKTFSLFFFVDYDLWDITEEGLKSQQKLLIV